MSHYDLSAIDVAHAKLVEGLVVAQKPLRVLEIGLGTGRTTNAIIAGLLYNGVPAAYTVVDSWGDFQDEKPYGVDKTFAWPINFVTALEREFVLRNRDTKAQWDFIFSDGDHTAADQWFGEVYDTMLAPGGILCYHDVNIVEENFINLREILHFCGVRGLRHKLFNKNSHANERCQRGLLVIFKP